VNPDRSNLTSWWHDPEILASQDSASRMVAICVS
jgi:hypothetical protein